MLPSKDLVEGGKIYLIVVLIFLVIFPSFDVVGYPKNLINCEKEKS